MSPRIGVVFIHGFLSSPTAWSGFLRLLGADDGLTATLALDTFQYATPSVSLNPLRRIPDLDDVADSLGTFLNDSVADHPRLVLVAHSQGGLVVQRLLARKLADGRGRELARIRRIVLFACPNSGSDLALLLRRRAFFWRHPQERELRPLNRTITDTHRIVVNQIIHASAVTPSSCPIRIIAYAGESDAVVTPASAKSVFPEVGVLPGDHFSIIRPDSRTHRSYTALARQLREVIDEPESTVPTQRPGPEPVAPEPAAPALASRSPTPATGTAQRRRGLVDALLAVPGMTDPAFRAQLFRQLPAPITDQLRRDASARLELFALVSDLDHYGHLAPWDSLAAALAALVPDHPAVAGVVTMLSDAGLLAAPPAAGLGEHDQ